MGHKNAATLFRSTVVSAVLDQLLLFLVHSIYTKLIYNAAVVDFPASPMYCCCTTLEKIFSSKTVSQHTSSNKLCGYVAATICPHPTLTFDLLTLKSVWESRVTWGTPVQSFVFLGLLVFELEPMYATSDRRTPITA